MRKLRAAVVAVFILSLIAYIGYNIMTRMTQDKVPPVITAESDTVSVSVEDDESKMLEGLQATDNKDGDLTESIRVSSMSNFTEPGKRTVNYVVFDESNNAATLTRNLEYTDYTSPQIRLSAPLRFSLDDMEEADLTGSMSVQDCLDGDISQEIRATYNDNAYVSQSGDYGVTVQVSNSAGDTCSVNLTVTVTDPENERGKYYPVLSDYIVYTDVGKSVNLSDLLIGLESSGTEYLFDDDDSFAPGDKSDVDISEEIDYNTAGTYNVDYTFTSDDGETATTKLAVVVR